MSFDLKSGGGLITFPALSESLAGVLAIELIEVKVDDSDTLSVQMLDGLRDVGV